METTVQSSNEYRNLPVAQLQESTTNPRRRFDEHSLVELAASLQAQGVLQPLLVRTIEDDKYEVIAGANSERTRTAPKRIGTPEGRNHSASLHSGRSAQTHRCTA